MKPFFTPYKKKIKQVTARRTVGIFLSAAMIFPMLPAGGMTVHASKEAAELCGHHPEHTAECGYETEGQCTYDCRICPIEDLIGALPGEVTEDNEEAVQKQLDEIFDRFTELTEYEQKTIDLSLCYTLQKEPAAAPILNPFEVTNDLDFSNAAADQGDLDTQGYHWDSGNKKLQLKNVRINSSVTLPDDAVTIETTGDCSIQKLEIGTGAPDKARLNFTGTGTLTVEQEMNISGGDGNILTVAAGASVIAEGRISIGTSGGTNSTVTVYGTLTAKSTGDPSFPAISAGTVVVGGGGLLEVSGKQGVQLNGMLSGSSYNVAGVFTVQEDGCFKADCEEYNVRALPLGGAFSPGSNPDQAFRIPEGYLPADCKVKWETDVVNLVRKSTEAVYTGPLIIGKSNRSPDDSGHDNTGSANRPAGGSWNIYTKPDDDSGDIDTKPDDGGEDIDTKPSEEPKDTSSGMDSENTPAKSPKTGAGDQGQQNGQARSPWGIMAAGALVLVMGIGGFSSVKRKKRGGRRL